MGFAVGKLHQVFEGGWVQFMICLCAD